MSPIESIGSSSKAALHAVNSRSLIGKAGNDRELKAACEQFEAVFIKQMLSAMRRSVEKSGLLEGGMAEDIFEDWLYDEYAQKMAQTGNFGLAESIFKQLKTLPLSGKGNPLQAYRETVPLTRPEASAPVHLFG